MAVHQLHSLAVVVVLIVSSSHAFDITYNATHFYVSLNGVELIRHSPEEPFLYVGSGIPTFEGQFGNYDVEDFVEERIALIDFVVDDQDPIVHFTLSRQNMLQVSTVDHRMSLPFSNIINISAH